MTDTLRVYVACLAAYNAGKLHGEWIEVEPEMEAHDLGEQIRAMLARSPEPHAEEWAIHDSESPVDFGIGEYESLGAIVAFAELIDDFEADALCAAVSLWSSSEGPAALRTLMEDRYLGSFGSAAEYAEESYADVFEIPEGIARYVDWSAFARDLELGGDISTAVSGGRTHVFTNG